MDLEKIYNDYFSVVYKYILSISKDSLTAEEITQETFFKALKKIDGFRGDCSLRVWLCQIAKNTYYDYLKQQSKFESIIDYKDSKEYVAACDEFFIKKLEESSRKRTKLIFTVASAVIVVVGIICAIVLPDPIRNARSYKQGNEYIDSGEYESAMTELEKLPEDYKDTAELIKECGYLKALADIEEKQYQRAIEFFEANLDYKDCDERYKEAKYQYVNRWKDRNNETTYQYLKDLKSIGYKDTAEIFEDLYAWEVTLDCCNTDSEDYDTTLDSIPTTTDYLHMEFILSGGEPGEVITVGHTTHWPGENASESSWYWEDRSDGGHLGIEWAKGVTTKYGTMTIEFYKDDGTFIDRISFSVKDVETQNAE